MAKTKSSSGTPFSGKLLIRIVAGLAIVGLAPLAFVAFRLVDLNYDAMLTQVLKSQSMIAASTAERISTYLEGWKTIGHTATGYDNPRSPESISVLQNLLASREDLLAAVVTDSGGGEVLRAQRREFGDEIDEVLAAVEASTEIVRIQGRPWLVVTYLYPDTSLRLRLVIQGDELEEAMRPAEFPEDAQIVLIEGNQELVLGPVGDLSMFPPELLTAAVAPEAASSRFELDGATILGAWGPVTGPDWHVVAMQPASIAEQIARRVSREAGLTVGISIVLVLVISIVAYLAVRSVNVELEKAYKTIEAQKERMQDELNVGRNIQMSMLSVKFPEKPEFSLHAVLEPAREVGGDLYDFFFIDDHRLCFLVGDVSGKGVPAALFMAVTKTLIKSLSIGSDSTGAVITRANDELSIGNESSMFVTLFVAVLDLRTGEIVCTNAGHNPPFMVRKDGSLERLAERHGPIAGAMEGTPYQEGRLAMDPGDLILLYTDGVVEAANATGEQFEEERLKEILANRTSSDVKSVVKDIVREVGRFEKGTEQTDDITVLALRFHGSHEQRPDWHA